ncbi:plasmid mobilization relaxosome protein MobC [Butyrivibrio sp. INlla16]|uniref:plasmid mobilization relaxosome protein MobC n=1 Tax=Butyrivibrio sp. INlla16 TaxID=1520807 RepID=UPI00088EB122|nr:plasmid mobilization relaxosome protein MobC [Butyrivibrio sp. INlla16]SDB50298.1 mobilisation protein (MobC) [Butyrivibrio sp. INlla16]
MTNRFRKNEVLLFLTDKELEVLNKKAKISGKSSRSAFLRDLIVHGLSYEVDYSYLKEYNTILGRISQNINQIAKRLNSSGSVYADDIKEIQNDMETIWQSQKFILSKQPLEDL